MIVVKKHILNTINRLDILYNSAPSEATYYSKLAVIELCGWIEVTMDKIAEQYASRKLKTTQYNDIFKNIVSSNYGFQYNKNFRKMLIQTIGIYNMEILETRINSTGKIAILISQLDILVSLRNDAAHTFLDATKTYQSPSVTKNQLETVYPILKEIHKHISSI